jgi:thiol:disulfide interchange protein DsbC
MNIPPKVFPTLWILMVIVTCTPLHAATPEESFRKSFPDIQMDSMKQTDIPGIYEIVSNGRVAYYAPGPRYLILGDIITEKKKNLTQERVEEMLALRIKTLPLKKALKIGSGPHTVIEITDPDCEFCRKAAEYFAKRKDVTRYIILYPQPTHPNAEAKIRYIFCAKDRAKAYEEAMIGKLDNMKFKPCDGVEAAELVKAHTELGEKVGSKGFGTPMFLIEGQAVMGFDMPKIEKILGAKK